MFPLLPTIKRTFLSGSIASLSSTITLMLVARVEGKAAVQPLNATSHWLNGDDAAECKEFILGHTGVGYATNHAACIFWALFFEAWRSGRPPAAPAVILREAMAMSAIAAAVDYGATPKRFTPGWELVLSKSGMAVVYGGLALGLAAGSLMTQAKRPGVAKNDWI